MDSVSCDVLPVCWLYICEYLVWNYCRHIVCCYWPW